VDEDKDNREARTVLSAIRDLALSLYPFPDGTQVDQRYAMALGIIAGCAYQALNAAEGDIPFNDKALREGINVLKRSQP